MQNGSFWNIELMLYNTSLMDYSKYSTRYSILVMELKKNNFRSYEMSPLSISNIPTSSLLFCWKTESKFNLDIF